MPPGQDYYLLINNVPHGPYTAEQIQDWIKSQSSQADLNSVSFAIAGSTTWQPISAFCDNSKDSSNPASHIKKSGGIKRQGKLKVKYTIASVAAVLVCASIYIYKINETALWHGFEKSETRPAEDAIKIKQSSAGNSASLSNYAKNNCAKVESLLSQNLTLLERKPVSELATLIRTQGDGATPRVSVNFKQETDELMASLTNALSDLDSGQRLAFERCVRQFKSANKEQFEMLSTLEDRMGMLKKSPPEDTFAAIREAEKIQNRFEAHAEALNLRVSDCEGSLKQSLAVIRGEVSSDELLDPGLINLVPDKTRLLALAHAVILRKQLRTPEESVLSLKSQLLSESPSARGQYEMRIKKIKDDRELNKNLLNLARKYVDAFPDLLDQSKQDGWSNFNVIFEKLLECADANDTEMVNKSLEVLNKTIVYFVNPN
jgi:hypothetical protein